MFEMRSKSVTTTQKGILEITSRVLKGSGSVAFLLLFLLAALSNANAATATTTVLKVGTAAAPGTSVTTEPYGTSVTLTATVTPTAAANATGTVAFTYGSSHTTITGCDAVVPSSGGIATCTTAALPVATSEVLVATFTPGSTTYASSSSTSPTFAVTSNTTTALKVGTAALPGTSVTTEPWNTSVTLTATVTPTAAANATGTVGFTYGSTPTTITGCGAVVPSSGGVATCTTAALPVATSEVLVATFTPGSSAYSSSSNTALAFAVTTATPTISISNIPGAGAAATGGSFTPTFTYSGDVVPTYKVVSNSTTICTVNTSTLAVSFLSLGGTCSLTASATATTHYAAVTGTAQTFKILTAQAALTVTGVPTSAQAYAAGFGVGSTGGSGTGAVTFSASGACSNSTANVTMTSGTGTCTVTATKAADTTYASATGSATVSATLAAQAALSVTGAPGSAAYNTTFQVSTTGGSSAGAVTYSTSGSCSNSTTTVTMTSGGGTCTVSATKAADTNYNSVTASATVNASTATQAALTVTLVPAQAQAYGTVFQVGSTGGSGTGAVTYSASGACANTGASVNMTSGTGTCSVTATKAADSNYASATSSASTVSATTATLTNTLTYSTAAIVAQGAPVTLTATVTPAAVASGTVNFQVGGNTITGCGAVAVNSGVATCVTSSANFNLLPAGADALTAAFDQTVNPSYFSNATPLPTGSASIQVNVMPNLVVSAAPYYFGAPLTLNVSNFPAAAVGESVAFLDGASQIATCTLNGGGSCTTNQIVSTLSVATHVITAAYAGGAAPAATSAPQNVSVVANPTLVALASTASYVALSNPSAFTLTATVTTADNVTVPAGHVTFYDSNTSLGTGTVSNGTATLTVSAAIGNVLTTGGTHYLIASYGGNYSALGVATFGPSLSKSAKVVVESTQTISHWYSGSTVYGTPITLSAVSSSDADPNGVPSASITYTVVSKTGSITAASLVGNTLTPNGTGTITINANLAGNANYSAATSVAKTFTVYPKPLTVQASSPTSTVISPITYGSAVPTISVFTPIVGLVGTDNQASLGPITCTTDYQALSTNHPGTYKTFCHGATNTNYDITLQDGSFTLYKATPTPGTLPTAATATKYAQLSTYPLSNTGATATGPFGTVAGVYSWTNPAAYLPVTTLGPVNPSVTFKPTATADYNTVATAITITNVAKADPAVSWPTAKAIAAGSLLSASTFTGGSSNGTFAWTTVPSTPFSTSGVYSENLTFTPNDATDYNTANHNINVTVTKGASTITSGCWPTGSTITYGAKLSTSTLSSTTSTCSGDTAGTFVWTSPNTIPAAGATVNASVTFTPTDTVNYSSMANTTTLTVNQATPTVSVWPTAAAITYPAVLSSTKLSGGSSGGTFAWKTPDITPPAGTATYTMTFTPTNTNYKPVDNDISLLVYQATATISTNPTAEPIRLGDALSASTLTPGTAADINSNPVNGSFTWSDDTITPGVGTSAQSVKFTPSLVGGVADFTTTTVSVNITVNACGYQDVTNSIYATALNVFIHGDTTTPLANPVLDAESPDESTVCAVNVSAGDVTALTITYPTITSGATASNATDSSTYGTNAAVLAYGLDTTTGHGATIAIQDDGVGNAGFISTNNDNSAGVFASMGGTADIFNTYVTTLGNSSPALKATYNGTLNISATRGSVTATTFGDNSPVLATGIGGGTVSSTGGVYTSIDSYDGVQNKNHTGLHSAGIHAAGGGSSITLNGDTVTAQNASAVELKGNSSLISTGSTSLSSALGDNHGIFLYFDPTDTLVNPLDAVAGASTFTMTGGSILYNCDAIANTACATSSPSGYQNSLPTLFSVANTTATINLTDVAVFNSTPYKDTNSIVNPNGNLLTVAAISGLGSDGSNGGHVTFNAIGEALVGDIIVDANSTAIISLAADTTPSTLTGNIGSATGGTVTLTLDATSTWVVTGNSYVTTLNNPVTDNSNITCSGTCAVYVNGSTTPLAGVK